MSRRDRMRARRRVERTMDEAWEAVQAGELGTAARLSRRARDQGGVNPRILLDHGRIMRICEEWDEAEASLRAAIAIAPNYGEAFAALAELQLARGKPAQAVRLQERAVELLPGDELAARALLRYRSALGEQAAPSSTEPGDPPPAVDTGPPDRSGRLDRFDWEGVADDAVRGGAGLLPRLLTPAECSTLRELYDSGACGAELESDDAGEGRPAGSSPVVYRYLSIPLPELVQVLREEVYARAAPPANDRELLLDRQPRFPPSLGQYLARAAGHRRAVRLLRLPAGGSLPPGREPRRRAFPLQLVVDLGPGAGGELALDDRRPGRKLRRHSLHTAEGDGVLHCLQDRIVRIGGIDGLQPVVWSFANTSRSERFALQLPFQDE